MTRRLPRSSRLVLSTALAAVVALDWATPVAAKMTTGVTCDVYPGFTTVTWNAREHWSYISLVWLDTSSGVPVAVGPSYRIDTRGSGSFTVETPYSPDPLFAGIWFFTQYGNDGRSGAMCVGGD